MKKLIDLNNDDLQYNGVYRIINIVNSKDYIGSCSAKDFLKIRLLHHRQDLLKNQHCNKYLQRSFEKYGIDNFYYEILEICNPEDCVTREQYYIDTLKPHYNLCKTAGSTFGRVFSEESRKKISKSQKKRWIENPELREKMSNLHKGKILTEEQRQNIINRQLNSKRSEETKQLMSEKRKNYLQNNPEAIQKMRDRMINRDISQNTINKMKIAAQNRNGKKIICLDNNIIFNCAREAAEYFEVKLHIIQDIMRGRRSNNLNIKYV